MIALKKNLVLVFCLLLANASAFSGQCELHVAKPSRIENGSAWFISKSGEALIKISEANFDDALTIFWMGPIDVFDQKERKLCRFEIEQIRPPFVFAQDKFLYFYEADAVNVAIKAIDLKSCKVAWESNVFSWYESFPRISWQSPPYVIVSKKKFPIQEDCLPSSIPLDGH